VDVATDAESSFQHPLPADPVREGVVRKLEIPL
jgi:hypothetical protein